MDLRCLEAFVSVAKTGSFSIAAERLYVSQSAVSKDVKKLEKELDLCLFDRSHRQVKLTASGERVLAHAIKLLEQYQCILRMASEGRVIRIAVLPVADSYGFPQVLSAYSKLNSTVSFRLEEQQNAAIMRMLQEGRVDAAFCRIFEAYDPAPNSVLIKRDRLVLLVRDEGQAESIVDLFQYRDQPFVFLDRSTGFWDASISLCCEAGFKPNICYVGSSRGNIVRLVQNGAGVALLAESVAAECAQQGLRMLYLSRTVESNLVFLCTEESGRMEEMRKLIAFLRNSIN